MTQNHQHLLREEKETLERSAVGISGKVLPTDGLRVVLERGMVELVVLFVSDILGVTTSARVRKKFRGRSTKLAGSRWVAES